jgi:hypothetical protein
MPLWNFADSGGGRSENGKYLRRLKPFRLQRREWQESHQELLPDATLGKQAGGWYWRGP